MSAPKLGAAEGAAEGAELAPKVKLAPNAGFAGVPKVVAVVVAAPKAKGAGAGLEADADDAPPAPKGKGFGAAEELKVGCAAGASKADFPKAKVDCVVEVAAAGDTVLVIPKAPNEAVVVFWPGAV